MIPFIQYLFSGLAVGATYALIALGISLVYSASSIANLSQGQLVVLGGLTAALLAKLGLPLPAVFLLTVLAVTALAIILERLVIYPISEAPVVTLIIITIGLAIALEGSAELIWGKDSYSFPPFSGEEPLNLLGVTIVPQTLWVIGIGLAVASGLGLFLNRTMMGRALRATAANNLAARLVGIDTRKAILASFAISAGVGAISGLVITPMTLMEYNRGFVLVLKGFAAVALGGLGSLAGAILGGFAIGVAEALGAGLVSSAYKDLFALAILLLIIFIRPAGLLGSSSDL